MATSTTSAAPNGPGAPAEPTSVVQRAADRARFDFGWLQTHHSFSFADYYDPENLNWGALRVFNDDVVQPGKGFGTHPHRDMEIVTYVFDGELEHKDSLGNHGVVRPGGVQYMSAGTGVLHSEFNHSPTAPVHFVQMWVLPATMGEPPAYGQEDYTFADRDGRWLTIASGHPDRDGARIALRNDAVLKVARVAAQPLTHAFAAGRYGFLFVGKGNIVANGEHLAAGDALRLHGAGELAIGGEGEVVLWDVVGTNVRLEDA